MRVPFLCTSPLSMNRGRRALLTTVTRKISGAGPCQVHLALLG